MIYIIQWEVLYQNKVISSLNSTCNHKMVYCVYQQKFYRPVCSFEFIQIRISDPRSLESWCFKKTTKSHVNTDSSVPGAHYQSEPLTHHVIRVILYHKSWWGSSQRNATYHSAALKPRELHSNSIVLIVGEFWSYALLLTNTVNDWWSPAVLI